MLINVKDDTPHCDRATEQQIRLIYAHAEHGEEVPLADTQCIKISLVLITYSLSRHTRG